MEVKIDLEELRKRKLFIGTPCYGGMCCASFAYSLIQLKDACVRYGIECREFFLMNESLVQRSRNYIADTFLRSDATHLLFIDADIGFKPDDVLTLLALQSDDSPYDVIAGLYAKKSISWEKIKLGVDKGWADEDPERLTQLVGDYVFNPIIDKGQTQIRLDQPAEVMETGTGFMMIRRKTLEDFAKRFPENNYLPDHVRNEHFDGSREICAFFDCVIDPKTKRYLSEDYYFCQKVREMGGKVWICPWINLSHTGSYVFGGSLAAIAQVGASPTADANLLKKHREKKTA